MREVKWVAQHRQEGIMQVNEQQGQLLQMSACGSAQLEWKETRLTGIVQPCNGE